MATSIQIGHAIAEAKKRHLRLADSLAGKGDYDPAIAEYRAYLQSDHSDSEEAHLGLGETLAKKGDLDGAIKEFRQALLLSGNTSYNAALQLGIALEHKGDVDDALIQYDNARFLAQRDHNSPIASEVEKKADAGYKRLAAKLHKE
jgi:tetratricopeptide (TPR) repeat protein